MSIEHFYFTCENCLTKYDYIQFLDLEHMSQASIGEERDTLGHAKCGNCTKDFYYSGHKNSIP